MAITDGSLIDGDGSTQSVVPTGDETSGELMALAYGITKELIALYPELEPIYQLFVKKRFTEARLAYYNSTYYKDLTQTSKTRTESKATQPGVYAQEFDAWKKEQVVRINKKGIKVTPQIEGLLEGYYLQGLTDLQIDAKILDSGLVGTFAGSTLGLVNTLKSLADDQGVSQLLGKNYWDKISKGLFEGSINVEDVEEEIKQTAMSAYPAYAKGIEVGRSFQQQTSALRQTIANLLEIDVDTINNNNSMFKQLVNYTNPKTKEPEIISLWEAEKIVKSSDQWMTTKNAKETFDNLALKVLKDWRLV